MIDTINYMIRKFDYLIFHKNCLDGFSAFIIMTNTDLIDNKTTIYPDVPSAKDPPIINKNKNVLIVDVAYKKEIVEHIFKISKYVLYIDHHQTVQNHLAELEPLYPQHQIIFDIKLCGSTLTWNYFFSDQKYPLYLKYINDNDTGKWKYKNTLYFVLALQVKYNFNLTNETISQWNTLFDDKVVYDLIKIGKKYYEYENYLLESNYKKYSLEQFPSDLICKDYPEFFTESGKYKIALIIGSGCPSLTALSKKILEEIKCDFCIFWNYHMDKKELVLSFRSLKINVGDIAKTFGGGGHDLAASASFPINKYKITDFFYSNSLPRQK